MLILFINSFAQDKLQLRKTLADLGYEYNTCGFIFALDNDDDIAVEIFLKLGFKPQTEFPKGFECSYPKFKRKNGHVVSGIIVENIFKISGPKCIKLLLKNNIEFKSNWLFEEYSPFFKGVEYAQAFLDYGGIDINSKNENGETLLI